jgi:hypothetical protein
MGSVTQGSGGYQQVADAEERPAAQRSALEEKKKQTDNKKHRE